MLSFSLCSLENHFFDVVVVHTMFNLLCSLPGCIHIASTTCTCKMPRPRTAQMFSIYVHIIVEEGILGMLIASKYSKRRKS